MGNVLFAALTPAAWLLFGIGLIAFNIFSRRFSADKCRPPGAFRKAFFAMVTFLFFFYSTTLAISLLYGVDSLLLNF